MCKIAEDDSKKKIVKQTKVTLKHRYFGIHALLFQEFGFRLTAPLTPSQMIV